MPRAKIDWLKLEAKIHVALRSARESKTSLRDTVFTIDAIMGDQLGRGYVFDTIDEVPTEHKPT